MPVRHAWNVTPAQAVAIQNRLRGLVERRDRGGRVRRVAGIDIGVKDDRARAAVVVLDWPSLETVEASVVEQPCRFPYVPGLLSFRECPSILAAFRRLRARPDLLMVDGHGIAHPRRFGIASHLGVLLDLPSIGCAKSLLTGEHAEPGRERGAWEPLMASRGSKVHGPLSKVTRHRNFDIGRKTLDLGPGTLDLKVIGAVVRTREGVRPVYVSIGHRVTLATAVRWVLGCGRGVRLPEPTRRAHEAAAR